MSSTSYRIELKPSADRALRRLPSKVQQRLVAAIDGLAKVPRPPGALKLVGESLTWRIRVGDYRIVYDIYDDRLIVLVVRIGHRKDVYK
ncbi:MAG: type II toxin-antitoxin system RelE/ParE family toxin [Planctomycetia bacterium]|nr:type II toxin-antitoxin system RelE/ParE family toxin [Planctomycetia bacterium]